MADPVADTAQHVLNPIFSGLGKIMQHIGRHFVLMSGMADPHPNPRVICTNVAVQRAQAIMTRMPATLLVAKFGGGQIDLVVKDRDVLGGQLVEAHSFAHGLAAEVHEGLWLEQHDLLAFQITGAQAALKLRPPRCETMIIRNPVERHESDIMTVMRVFRAGIAKANDEFHGTEVAPS